MNGAQSCPAGCGTCTTHTTNHHRLGERSLAATPEHHRHRGCCCPPHMCIHCIFLACTDSSSSERVSWIVQRSVPSRQRAKPAPFQRSWRCSRRTRCAPKASTPHHHHHLPFWVPPLKRSASGSSANVATRVRVRAPALTSAAVVAVADATTPRPTAQARVITG